MDYRVYHCSVWENIQWIALSVLVTAVLAWLFYQSSYGMMLLPAVGVFCRKRYVISKKKKRQQMLLYQFKEGIQAVQTALLAGYSVENAWREAEKELQKLYGEEGLLTKEWHRMNVRIGMNESLEKQLMEFAVRSNCEDVESFAEVFSFAKRSGGNFVKIIKTTVTRIAGKIEVEKEIETVLSGKKLEARIMNGMPLFILAYLNAASQDFLQVLYGNVLGVSVMTIVLAVYMLTLKLSDWILDIHV